MPTIQKVHIEHDGMNALGQPSSYSILRIATGPALTWLWRFSGLSGDTQR